MLEPPPPAPARSLRPTSPVAWVVLGGLAAAVTVAAVITLGGGNKNSTFSFVGSAIRPTSGGPRGPESVQLDEVAGVGREAAPQAPPAPPVGAPAPPKADPVERRIIFTATLDVVVPSVTAADDAVNAVVPQHKGYVAQSDLSAEKEGKGRATYTVRVPADGLRPLLAAFAKLGAPGRTAIDSKDVTEEFVDTESRVRNLKQEEEALNKILKEKTIGVNEVLTLRQHILPVREGIERAEGRLRYLTAMSALSTITLTLRETPEPPAPQPETPDKPFGERAESTFGASWKVFAALARNTALVFVAVAAWLPLILPGVLIGWVAYRRGRRRAAA